MGTYMVRVEVSLDVEVWASSADEARERARGQVIGLLHRKVDTVWVRGSEVVEAPEEASE